MVLTRELQVATRGNGDVTDITDQVSQEVARSGVSDGIVTLFVPGSTAGLTTIEYESGAVRDLQEMFERIASAQLYYHHNLRWGDGNGHAHVRAALLGASLTVPFSQKRLLLGTWQQVVAADRPSTHKRKSRRHRDGLSSGMSAAEKPRLIFVFAYLLQQYSAT